jgi:hypothetical protein
MAGLITAFENIGVHPDYRADVFNILNTATNLGAALLDQTYPVEEAMKEVTNLMAILPRMIHHLNNRPTTSGFAIMLPATQDIFPQIYSTETEATEQLRRLQSLGAGKAALVVPVQITSSHVVRPVQQIAPPPPLAAPFSPMLPPGIMPTTPPPIPVLELEPEEPELMDPQALRAHLDRLDHDSAELVEVGAKTPPAPETAPEAAPAAGPVAGTSPPPSAETPPTPRVPALLSNS